MQRRRPPPPWAPPRLSEETVNRLRSKLRAAAYSVDGQIDLERLFRKFDRDRSGTLSRSEFSRAIRRTLRISRIPKQEIRMLLDTVDPNRTNRITYEDFARFVLRDDEDVVPLRKRRRKPRGKIERQRNSDKYLLGNRVLYQCMKISRGERFVSVSELREILSDSSVSSLTSTQIEELIEYLDSDRTNSIDLGVLALTLRVNIPSSPLSSSPSSPQTNNFSVKSNNIITNDNEYAVTNNNNVITNNNKNNETTQDQTHDLLRTLSRRYGSSSNVLSHPIRLHGFILMCADAGLLGFRLHLCDTVSLFHEAAKHSFGKKNKIFDETIELSSLIDALSRHLFRTHNNNNNNTDDDNDASTELRQHLYNRLVIAKKNKYKEENNKLCNLLSDRAVYMLNTHSAALRYIFIRYALDNDENVTRNWRDRDRRRMEYIRSKDVSIDMESFVAFAKDYRLWPEHLDRTQLRHLFNTCSDRLEIDSVTSKHQFKLFYHGFEEFLIRCAFEICSGDRSKRVTDISIESLFRMMDPRESIFRVSSSSSLATTILDDKDKDDEREENEEEDSVRLALRSEVSRPLLRQLYVRCSSSTSPRHVLVRLLWMSRCLFTEAPPYLWTIDLSDAIESANMYFARSSKEPNLAHWEAFVHALTIISERVFPSKSRKESLSRTIHLLLASPPSMLLPESDIEQSSFCVSRLVLRPLGEAIKLFRTMYDRYSRENNCMSEDSVRRIFDDFELCPLQITLRSLERHVIRSRMMSKSSSNISFGQFMEILARCAVELRGASSSNMTLEVCARRLVELFRERANSVIPIPKKVVKKKRMKVHSSTRFLLNDKEDDESQASHWLFLRYATNSNIDLRQWLRFCEDIKVFGHCNLPVTDSISIFLKTMRTSSSSLDESVYTYKNTRKLELNAEDFQRALRAMCTRIESSPKRVWEIARQPSKSRRWYLGTPEVAILLWQHRVPLELMFDRYASSSNDLLNQESCVRMYCDFGIIPRHVTIRETRVAFDVILTLHRSSQQVHNDDEVHGIYFGEFLELLVRTALKRESSSTGSLSAAAVQSVMRTVGCGLFDDPDNIARAAGISPLLIMNDDEVVKTRSSNEDEFQEERQAAKCLRIRYTDKETRSEFSAFMLMCWELEFFDNRFDLLDASEIYHVNRAKRDCWLNSTRHVARHFGHQRISELETKSRRNRDPTLTMQLNQRNSSFWPVDIDVVSRVLKHRERLLRFIYASSVLNRHKSVRLDLSNTEMTSRNERVMWTAVLERNAFMTLDKYVECVTDSCPNLLTRSQWESLWDSSQTHTNRPNSFYYPHFVLSLVLAAKKIVKGGAFRDASISQRLDVLLTLFLPDQRCIVPLNVYDLLRDEPYSTSISCAWWRWKGLSSFEHQVAVSTMQLLRGYESSLLELFERYSTMEEDKICQSDACRFADDFNVSRFVRRQCLLSSELRIRDMTSISTVSPTFQSDEFVVPLIQSQIYQIFFCSWRSYMTDRVHDDDDDDGIKEISLDFDSFVEFCGRVAIAIYMARKSSTLNGHAPDYAIDIVQSFLKRLNDASVHLTDELFDMSLLS